MLKRIRLREVLAWVTLAVAIILFSVSVSFAQTSNISVTSDNGKVHIKIDRSGKGKTISIDTTFTATDETDIEQILQDLTKDEDQQLVINKQKVKIVRDGKKGAHDKQKKEVVITVDSPDLSEADQEKLHKDLKKSMKDMKESLREMQTSLQSMHIHIYDSEDGEDAEDSDFNFDFNFPKMDMEQMGNSAYAYAYSFSDDDEADSLRDEDHVVIIGDKDEKAPELEKIITSKNGKQIFVYKRSGDRKKEMDKEVENDNSISSLKIYPNPASGKFNLSFMSEGKDDITIRVLDSNSKEVYTEKINDFSGQYSKEIDLTGKSKGNYVVKIIKGGTTATMKVVLN